MFELDGDGGFARGREACEPDCEAALAPKASAFGPGERGRMVGDVSRLEPWLEHLGNLLGAVMDYGNAGKCELRVWVPLVIRCHVEYISIKIDKLYSMSGE
jgi:hypothetical protein